MLNSIVSLILLMIPLKFAHAEPEVADWTEKGNGGDVIVCQDASKNKMYDAFEAEVRHGFQLHLPPSNWPSSTLLANYSGLEDLDEALRISAIIIGRVQQKDPLLYEKLEQTLSAFKGRVRFVGNTDLIDIEDMGVGFIPHNCTIQQLVIQRRPKFPTDRLYTVALDYWQTLTIQHKAVAIVHEVIYHVALKAHPTNSSESVRYFNALLLGDKLKDLSLTDYRDVYDLVFAHKDSY